jgi:hypothetical protein
MFASLEYILLVFHFKKFVWCDFLFRSLRQSEILCLVFVKYITLKLPCRHLIRISNGILSSGTLDTFFNDFES